MKNIHTMTNDELATELENQVKIMIRIEKEQKRELKKFTLEYPTDYPIEFFEACTRAGKLEKELEFRLDAEEQAKLKDVIESFRKQIDNGTRFHEMKLVDKATGEAYELKRKSKAQLEREFNLALTGRKVEG